MMAIASVMQPRTRRWGRNRKACLFKGELMPRPGDSCDPSEDKIAMSGGEVLVCRRGTWQRVGEAAPVDSGVLPSRERTKDLLAIQRKNDQQRASRGGRPRNG